MMEASCCTIPSVLRTPPRPAELERLFEDAHGRHVEGRRPALEEGLACGQGVAEDRAAAGLSSADRRSRGIRAPPWITRAMLTACPPG